MQQRHDILEKTIGFLDEEQEALDRGYSMLIGSFTCLGIGVIFEILFFWLYNGPCHPFANILKTPSDECKIQFNCFSLYKNLLKNFYLFRFHV